MSLYAYLGFIAFYQGKKFRIDRTAEKEYDMLKGPEVLKKKQETEKKFGDLDNDFLDEDDDNVFEEEFVKDDIHNFEADF